MLLKESFHRPLGPISNAQDVILSLWIHHSHAWRFEQQARDVETDATSPGRPYLRSKYHEVICHCPFLLPFPFKLWFNVVCAPRFLVSLTTHLTIDTLKIVGEQRL